MRSPARFPPSGGLALRPVALVVLGLVLGTSPGLPGDCNGNEVPDKVDISSGASDDCNSNGLPDE